jgi:hypothetical protein
MWRSVRILLAVASCLCCLQEPLPALADSPCSVQSNQASQLSPNNLLATRLVSGGTQSFIEVKCSGKSSGSLKLTIDGFNSEVYGGSAQIRLVSANGIFAASPSEFTAGALDVPYSLLSGSGVGKIMYQVQVSAPNRRLLQAARDYSVAVSAELLP